MQSMTEKLMRPCR